MQHRWRGARTVAVAATVALGLAACGGDDEDVAETGNAPEESTTTSEAEEETEGGATSTTATGGEGEGGEVGESDEAPAIEVTGVDYAFEGLPATIAAGTLISFTNATENDEAHEFVAIRIPDTETRPVADLVALPPEERDALFADVEPATVIFAAPGETDVPGAVVGDGTIGEPGRYAVVCFIPVGADPAAVLDPNAEGPPESDDPPHAALGMFAEVTVE